MSIAYVSSYYPSNIFAQVDPQDGHGHELADFSPKGKEWTPLPEDGSTDDGLPDSPPPERTPSTSEPVDLPEDYSPLPQDGQRIITEPFNTKMFSQNTPTTSRPWYVTPLAGTALVICGIAFVAATIDPVPGDEVALLGIAKLLSQAL